MNGRPAHILSKAVQNTKCPRGITIRYIKGYDPMFLKVNKKTYLSHLRVTLVVLWSVRGVERGTKWVLCPGAHLTAMCEPLPCTPVCPTCAAGSTRLLLPTNVQTQNLQYACALPHTSSPCSSLWSTTDSLQHRYQPSQGCHMFFWLWMVAITQCTSVFGAFVRNQA